MESRKGFVINYSIDLLKSPDEDEVAIYFRVTICDDTAGTVNPQEFVLLRNVTTSVDLTVTGNPLAQPYGSIEMAIIATIKDALFRDNPVTINYVPGHAVRGAATAHDRIRAVKIARI